MKIEFLSKFNQDLNRIHLKSVRNSLLKVIELTQSAETLAEIPNLKKLQGFKSAYRIRIGDYRIGIFIAGNTIQFARVLNRKEIYKYLP
ncbi:MAG: type II toxin-antitoxin system RelE/ParE family toxin [Cytophagales bacterium]|jgi:mRNA interferase RelE/StbE|nr:type II toxin-antitoxin system RelE/ParE family toxin [Cytophagales bacterium]MCA6387179.1 type II toxin-antitoxin system RelE/ParE family toxin [Cytophagales bacterium]MCA6392974.1 type II toxin-antitoxin system RelE/ParE family toxin [Cytophagales bacterium]MCA6396515.1 type II toxin-antitoxin system RelE/ParE family toxin [Cytophagales bacterium]MCA6397643.1 type II toxin-antitoxin system RelE/ParE family toxin [Cytophagales bacterium]